MRLIMIKKFNEFNESEKDDDILGGISKDEIEDQFLRLVEILECEILEIKMEHKREDIFEDDYYYWHIKIKKPDLFHTTSKITHDELEIIKSRIESMYPVKMRIKNQVYGYDYDVFIKLK